MKARESNYNILAIHVDGGLSLEVVRVRSCLFVLTLINIHEILMRLTESYALTSKLYFDTKNVEIDEVLV